MLHFVILLDAERALLEWLQSLQCKGGLGHAQAGCYMQRQRYVQDKPVEQLVRSHARGRPANHMLVRG